MDPELVVYRPAALTEVLGRGTSRERFALVMIAAFAAVSLTLASLGLYGVLAHAVRQRTLEIGIRIALGATAAQIRLSILRQASVVLISGLVVGTVGALVLGRWLTSLTFGIGPSDPRILAAAAVLLTTTGFFASWLPARRASRIEPRVAIQEG
jgi:putative ABC transport system permease protein